MMERLFRTIYRGPFRRAARAILQGRASDFELPESGRWSRRDVDAYLTGVWDRVEALLPTARLRELPSVGNRHNVFLAVVTMAAYQVMLERGVERGYAMQLVGDVGWKVYERMLSLASLPFRLTTRDPRRRLDRTLRALMVFPFDAPGAPGYQVETWPVADGRATHWTHCPPQSFVRRLIAEQGDRGELEAFYRSWCLYDWPGADVIAADGRRGHYERPHTLSKGDPVCDMCWYATRDPRPSRGPAPSGRRDRWR